jgi:molecular chaperone DnaK (HSP70)
MRIYGIDLGTTYSCIAYVNEYNKPEVIENREDDNAKTMPSVVYFESADNYSVGKAAKNSARLYPDLTVDSIKREMGHSGFSLEFYGKSYKPEEISSLILRKLVNYASATVEEPITDVVITCPAYFGINEREATKNAGKIAGLNVRHILNEPTAAAVCYGLDKHATDQVVLVYDLGGGTFDVTMIEIKGGNTQVIYTDGNHSLGGKDWDARLVDYLATQFMEQFPDKGDPRDDVYSLQAIVLEAEEIKKRLSSTEKAVCPVSHGGSPARVEVTRTKQEELTVDLLEQTITLTRHVLEEGKARGYSKIDKILLVGGSSLMPCVARRVKSEFGVETEMFEPHLAVAKGAALVGAQILAGELVTEEVAALQGKEVGDVEIGKVDSRTLEEAGKRAAAKAGSGYRLGGKEFAAMAGRTHGDVTSKGFGVVAWNEETGQEEVVFLIHNNTPVPVEVIETSFGILTANQSSVKLRVMEQAGQAESEELSNNVELGQGEISPLPQGLPAGSPIHVTFRLTEDGTLEASASEPSSGQQLELKIEVKSVMSEDDVEKSKRILLKKTVS